MALLLRARRATGAASIHPSIYVRTSKYARPPWRVKPSADGSERSLSRPRAAKVLPGNEGLGQAGRGQMPVPMASLSLRHSTPTTTTTHQYGAGARVPTWPSLACDVDLMALLQSAALRVVDVD
ncbi:uncharacterized protein SETTUDRAFT_36806 [Exserohilum turcica Et28A]|uniref:Uncharacterized protein n=1 Tax=Exserohilum turcicum (strain 28A) TaxID=671987 RepID=R0KM41_EXST2|nr:uncharacterized protein SETTUDRAFT_36806 [Exserohilum turcica Et28A]EOA90154.1 hypothetical protein SETTUDRAFT_36806 [Exserohilum turcica Et28A]